MDEEHNKYQPKVFLQIHTSDTDLRETREPPIST
jgi:hypothetical protein